jgi:hypothetical protein
MRDLSDRTKYKQMNTVNYFSRPDKLLNLSLARLCEEALFLDESEQNLLMEVLPPNLRPFGGI